MEKAKKGKPFGFYVCALGFTFERLAFYTVKYLLAIWIATEVASGGLGLSDVEGAAMSGSFVAWTYITPIFGGYIADHWISPRICVPLGMILMGLGYVCTWKADSMTLVWAMIILVSIGTGLFKGNLSGINGLLFHDAEELDEAFSIQYSFVNIGSFCGTTFLSLIGTNAGYRTMFLVCGIFLFIDCVWWFVGMKSFGDAGKKPFLVDNRSENVEKADKEKDNAPLTKLEKNRIIAILIVTVFSGIFWLIWYMAYMPVYYEFGPVSQGGSGWANWNIGSFEMPTAWFDSMNGLLCIILCPIFAGIWAKMRQRPQGDWGMFTKTALGIIILGLCTGSMVLAAALSGQGTKDPVGIWVIILASVCMSLGEVIFSPLGNAFISKYAPKKLLGTMLGVWPLIIFFSGKAYGPLYNWLGNFDFVKAYGVVTIIIVACGVIMLAFTKKFDKMVEGK